MDRLLLPLIGLLAMLAAGAGGMAAWDRHGPFGVHVPVLWWHLGFDLPPSLAQRAEAAERAEKSAAQAVQACRGSLDAQNAAIALLSRDGQAALAKAQHDLQAAHAVAESYRRQAAGLAGFTPAGATQCEAWDSADQAVLDAMNAKVVP